MEKNDFMYDEQLGCYKKMIDQDTYFILPNQSMPEYFDFSTHFHATFLDYYDEVNGDSIWIRWSESGKKDKIEYLIYCLDEYGNINYTFSEEQEEKLRDENSYLDKIITDGKNIYADVYE